MEPLEDRRPKLCKIFARKSVRHPKHKFWFQQNAGSVNTRSSKPNFKIPLHRLARFQRKSNTLSYKSSESSLKWQSINLNTVHRVVPVDVDAYTLPCLVCNQKHCYLSPRNKPLIIIIINFRLLMSNPNYPGGGRNYHPLSENHDFSGTEPPLDLWPDQSVNSSLSVLVQ